MVMTSFAHFLHRPSVILDEVGVFAEYPYVSSLFFGAKPNIGLRGALAVDMARVRAGPDPSATTCDKVITTKYDFDEPLLFEVSALPCFPCLKPALPAFVVRSCM